MDSTSHSEIEVDKRNQEYLESRRLTFLIILLVWQEEMYPLHLHDWPVSISLS